jgi:DNA-directed RNA polymerase subunit RPC12/RpoP
MIKNTYTCPKCKAKLKPKNKKIWFKTYTVIECESNKHKYLRKLKTMVNLEKLHDETPVETPETTPGTTEEEPADGHPEKPGGS